MDGITRIAAGESTDKVTRMRFRRSASGRPEQEVIARQSKIALLAFQAFSSSDAAREFLNAEDQRFGGRPIEIAGRDQAGYDAISAALPSPPRQANRHIISDGVGHILHLRPNSGHYLSQRMADFVLGMTRAERPKLRRFDAACRLLSIAPLPYLPKVFAALVSSRNGDTNR